MENIENKPKRIEIHKFIVERIIKVINDSRKSILSLPKNRKLGYLTDRREIREFIYPMRCTSKGVKDIRQCQILTKTIRLVGKTETSKLHVMQRKAKCNVCKKMPRILEMMVIGIPKKKHWSIDIMIQIMINQ